MRDEIKAQRLADLFGLVVPEELKAPDPARTYENETRSREAEAVLAYVYNPHKFVQKECKFCGLIFAVSRANVNKCSDRCRIAELANMGITWDPSKSPEERWDFKEPLVVPPQALMHLQPIVEKVQVQLAEELETVAAQQQNQVSNDLDNLLAEFDL